MAGARLRRSQVPPLPELHGGTSAAPTTMHEHLDWLICGLRSCKHKLRRSIGPDPQRLASETELRSILLNWDIDGANVEHNLGGSSGASWLVATASGRYVLRWLGDGDRAWVEFEIRAMRHLAESNFPYQTPEIVRTSRSSDTFFDGRYYWCLCSFLKGLPALQASSARRANNVGTLVAHYDHAMKSIDLEDLAGDFHLGMFDVEHTIRCLEKNVDWLLSRKNNYKPDTVIGKQTNLMLRFYSDLPAAQINKVKELNKTVVYNDWHPHNMITRHGRIVGLIDYDSVVEAPTMVGFQNALTHILISKPTVDRDLALAFAAGYGRVLQLAPVEVSLIGPIMLDRVCRLIADVLDRVRRESSPLLQELAIRLIRLGAWLKENEELLTEDVAVHVGRR